MTSDIAAASGFFVISGEAEYRSEEPYFCGKVFIPKKGSGRTELNIGSACKVVQHQVASREVRGRTSGVLARVPINGNLKVKKVAGFFDPNTQGVTCPTAIASLIKKQNLGEEGEMLVDGTPNLFMIAGYQGGLFILKACFRDGSWHLEAYPANKVFAGNVAVFFGPKRKAA